MNGKNKTSMINTWAVAVLRYGAGITGWSKKEVWSLDRAMRKIMTMNGALHLKGDVDRLYGPKVKGGHGLISCESCI